MFLYYKTSQSLYFVNLIYYCLKEVFTWLCGPLLYSDSVTQFPGTYTEDCCLWKVCLWKSCLAFYSVHICLLDSCYVPMHGGGQIFHEVQRLVGKADMQTHFYTVGLVQGWLWVRKILENKEEQTLHISTVGSKASQLPVIREIKFRTTPTSDWEVGNSLTFSIHRDTDPRKEPWFTFSFQRYIQRI